MGAPRMRSWRDHPVMTGEMPKPSAVPSRPHGLPPHGRYAVRTLAGRYLVINHAGNPVATMKVTRRDAEELAEKLNGAAEREERVGQARRRPCLSCAREFMSEGNHNRLCPYCRSLGHSPVMW